MHKPPLPLTRERIAERASRQVALNGEAYG